MRRRDLLRGLAVGGLSAGTIGSRVRAGGYGGSVRQTAQSTIGETYWDSAASLLTPSMEPITSDDGVLVRARETAAVTDEDGNGDAVSYGDASPVLAARDGSVIGLGGMLAGNDTDFAYGNDEFLLNVYDELTGDGSQIAWDTSHDQFWVPGEFATFVEYAESIGYTIEETTDVTSLDGADLLVVTSPASAFTDAELSAIASFRESGGGILLHDQSDFRNFDQTANLNAIADHLGVSFRFNDDQVVDEESNAGPFYQPTTDVYPGSDALYATRDGVPPGPEYSFDETYQATVEDISDGDTFSVTLEGGASEEIRVLGIDTPEVPEAADAENPYEWEGIGDQESGEEADGEYPYLQNWAAEASSVAGQELSGATVELSFDENEGIEDPFGRLLAYVSYDAGSGSRDRLWSRELIERGLARVYDSGLSRHDALLEAELAARADGRGVWTESDPTASRTLWNGPVEQLFFPEPVAVGTFGGGLSDERVPVRAPASADDVPLVGIDAENRVAAVGGIPAADDFWDEEFPVDAASAGNQQFLTNLLDALSDRDGDVLWDGGHGQFNESGGVSAEAAARYQRYLEGVDLGLEQVNSYGGLMSRGRALVVTQPASSFTSEELSAITSFRDAGGAVIVAAAGSVSANRIELCNTLLAELGSDLTLDTEVVSDGSSPEGVVTTTAFNDQFGLFGSFESGTASLAATPTTTADETTAASETTVADETTGAGETTGADETTTEGPGFGAVAGAVSAVGGGLLAARRLLNDNDDGE